MANDFTGPVWNLDTFGATSAKTQPVNIKAILYSGHTSGDVVQLHDAASGDIIFELTDNTSPVAISFNPPLSVKGIYLTTLTAGNLLVYV